MQRLCRIRYKQAKSLHRHIQIFTCIHSNGFASVETATTRKKWNKPLTFYALYATVVHHCHRHCLYSIDHQYLWVRCQTACTPLNRIATTAAARTHTQSTLEYNNFVYIAISHCMLCAVLLLYCCLLLLCWWNSRSTRRPLPSYLSPLSFSFPLCCARSILFFSMHTRRVYTIFGLNVLGWIANVWNFGLGKRQN